MSNAEYDPEVLSPSDSTQQLPREKLASWESEGLVFEESLRRLTLPERVFYWLRRAYEDAHCLHVRAQAETGWGGFPSFQETADGEFCFHKEDDFYEPAFQSMLRDMELYDGLTIFGHKLDKLLGELWEVHEKIPEWPESESLCEFCGHTGRSAIDAIAAFTWDAYSRVASDERLQQSDTLELQLKLRDRAVSEQAASWCIWLMRALPDVDTNILSKQADEIWAQAASELSTAVSLTSQEQSVPNKGPGEWATATELLPHSRFNEQQIGSLRSLLSNLATKFGKKTISRERDPTGKKNDETVEWLVKSVLLYIE